MFWVTAFAEVADLCQRSRRPEHFVLQVLRVIRLSVVLFLVSP